MRTEPYGMYYWWNYNVSGNQRYDFIMMHTEKSIGGRNWYAFLKVLRSLCENKNDDLTISDYAYNNSDGKFMYLTTPKQEYKISVTQVGYDVYDNDDNLLKEVKVSQNDEGIDTEDRVVIGMKLIEELRTSKL